MLTFLEKKNRLKKVEDSAEYAAYEQNEKSLVTWMQRKQGLAVLALNACLCFHIVLFAKYAHLHSETAVVDLCDALSVGFRDH